MPPNKGMTDQLLFCFLVNLHLSCRKYIREGMCMPRGTESKKRRGKDMTRTMDPTSLQIKTSTDSQQNMQNES